MEHKVSRIEKFKTAFYIGLLNIICGTFVYAVAYYLGYEIFDKSSAVTSGLEMIVFREGLFIYIIALVTVGMGIPRDKLKAKKAHYILMVAIFLAAVVTIAIALYIYSSKNLSESGIPFPYYDARTPVPIFLSAVLLIGYSLTNFFAWIWILILIENWIPKQDKESISVDEKGKAGFIKGTGILAIVVGLLAFIGVKDSLSSRFEHWLCNIDARMAILAPLSSIAFGLSMISRARIIETGWSKYHQVYEFVFRVIGFQFLMNFYILFSC